MLLTHLYQFFGVLLGCTQQGKTGFSAYKGEPSMYNVHKFMDLDAAEVGYFITQVGLAASSFGVATDDINTVAGALEKYFDVKCAPAVTLAPALGSQLQAICIAEDCPLAPNATCSAYGPAVEPGVANSTLAMGQGNSSSTATASAPASSGTSGGSSSPSSTASGSATSPSAAAAPANAAGVFAAAGLAAAAFFL